MSRRSLAPGFPALLQEFFCQHLLNQRNASLRTIASYRDAFRLLLQYVEERRNKRPADVTLGDLGAPCILAFLDYLEKERRNCIRSRNARLAAIRSFFTYVAAKDPASLPTIQRVLAIPMKRFERPLLGFLSAQEVQAILEAPSVATFSGRRDRVLFALMYNTGARVSEMAALHVGDVVLDRCPCIRLHGKGRKERTVPLWQSTARQLKQWMSRIDRKPDSPLLPNVHSQPLTRSGIESRLREAVRVAVRKQPSLKSRRISPHTLRHTTAMHLLQSGVDITIIALWLGHESPAATHLYVEADLTLKERALSKLNEPTAKRIRYRPTDRLLRFLEGL
jgi:site-specific recombinase XerD